MSAHNADVVIVVMGLNRKTVIMPHIRNCASNCLFCIPGVAFNLNEKACTESPSGARFGTTQSKCDDRLDGPPG